MPRICFVCLYFCFLCGVLCGTVSFSHCGVDGRISGEQGMRKDLEGSGRRLMKVPSQRVPEGTGE